METIHLNGVNSIKGEINAILTLLRVNTRWSSAGGKIRNTTNANHRVDKKPSQNIDYDSLDENPLVGPFRKLNRYLEGIYEITLVDTVSYIAPFHNIIVSEQASGPLTCAALGSLVKFVSYGFLSSSFPRSKEGIAMIASCISGCIFEETDWESDEVILMKLLELSTLVYRCDAAKLLSVGSAWEIYSTCISIHAQYRASKILKSEAESALRNLTLTAFSRAHLSTIASPDLEDGSTLAEDNDNGFLQMMKDKTWDKASMNYEFEGPVGIPLLLGKIMTVLSGLMDLQSQPIPTVRFSLALVNIALEAGGPSLGSIPILVEILRGDICRHLLKASQSDNLEIFSLALRVVFNLFMSIKDHVKIQLEVFLTSVHLRLLSSSQSSIISLAREELALESLLEFCREPSLIQDIYTNYDCDVQCTNLFDAIISILSQRSLPEGFTLSSSSNNHLSENDALSFNNEVDVDIMARKPCVQTTILNRLALDGIISILHAISLRCDAFAHECKQRASFRRDSSWSTTDSIPTAVIASGPPSPTRPNLTPTKGDASTVHSPDLSQKFIGKHDDRINGRDKNFKVGETILEEWKSNGNLHHLFNQVSNDSSGISSDTEIESVDESKNGLGMSVDEDESDFVYQARAKTAEILRQRKLKKQKMRVAADKFNAQPMKADWLQYCLETGLIAYATASTSIYQQRNPSTTTAAISQSMHKSDSGINNLLNMLDAKNVARFLRNTPGLGKSQIGEFISKGPADLYPFHASVLREYVDTFEFSGKHATFDKALRLFLGHFRLPGEAQCIDRIMEAFAGKLFRDLGPNKPFKSSDSAFILAFSTIMLNTDLHNPQIPVNKKMTKDQYIRNNRGINDGEDLPKEFLEQLYDEIKSTQIQLDTDIVDIGATALANIDITDPEAWNKLIKKRSRQNAPAVFTPTVAAREVAQITVTRKSNIESNLDDMDKSSRLYMLPIIHEKDMFLVMANQSFEALMIIWTHVEDDAVTNKLLDGTCDFIRICINLNLPVMFDGIIKILATRTICITEYEKVGNKSWSLKQKQRKLEKKTMSWDDFYDTASLIAEERDGVDSSIMSKYSSNIYKESLEQLLAAKFETIVSPNASTGLNSLENVSRNMTNENAMRVPSSKSMSWIGSSKIRGEIVLKMLLYFVEENPNMIAQDGWTAIIAVLLYARSLGVLPPPLAFVREGYEGLLPNTKIPIILPLTHYGQCFLDGVSAIGSNPNRNMESNTTTKDLIAKKSVAIEKSTTNDNKSAKATGFWGTIGSFIWSNADDGKTSAQKDLQSELNAGKYSESVISLSGLHAILLAKKPIPLMKDCSYRAIDGNCRNHRRIHEDPNSDSFSPVTSDENDMLRLVLLTSHIDQIIFISWKIEKITYFIFDALIKYFQDVLAVIITHSSSRTINDPASRQRNDGTATMIRNNDSKTTESHDPNSGPDSLNENHIIEVTLVHAQRDAVMLLEWMMTILITSPTLSKSLWQRLEKNAFQPIFESDLEKILRVAPFLIERCVSALFTIAINFLASDANNQERNDFVNHPQLGSRNNSFKESIWESLSLLSRIPALYMEELGGHIAAGTLTLLRTSPGISQIDNSYKWHIIIKLFRSSSCNAIGRVFVWEGVNDIIDDNNYFDSNYFYLLALLNHYLFGDFAIDHALEINLSKMPNEIPSNIDRSGPWISSALMHLLKLTLSALHFDVNVDENIANGTSSSTTILFPLPKWPLSSSSLNMTKRHSTVGSERAKIIYKASIECSSAIEGSLGPSNNCNQQSPAPITSSQASTVNENPYFATHLSFKYIKMNREDAINLWTQSCRMTAHLVDLKSNYAVSRRALFCLKILLDKGNSLNLMELQWIDVIHDLVTILPIRFQSNLKNTVQSYQVQSNQTNPSSDKTHYLSDSEDICLQSCNLIFEIIIQRGKSLRPFIEFQNAWLKLLSNLAFNTNSSLKVNEYFRREILEMLCALLRLLQPSTKPTRSLSSSSRGSASGQIRSTPTKAQSSANQTFNHQSVGGDGFKGKDLITDKTNGSNGQANNGLYGLIGGLFGWNQTNSGNQQVNRDRNSGQVPNNNQNQSNIALSRGETVHDGTLIEIDHNQPVVDVVATATATAVLQTDSVTAELITPIKGPDSIEGSVHQLPTWTDDSARSSDVVADMPLASSQDIENERLLAISWKTISDVCGNLTSQLKSHNPNLVSDLIRTVEDVQLRIHYEPSILPEPSPHKQDAGVKLISPTKSLDVQMQVPVNGVAPLLDKNVALSTPTKSMEDNSELTTQKTINTVHDPSVLHEEVPRDSRPKPIVSNAIKKSDMNTMSNKSKVTSKILTV